MQCLRSVPIPSSLSEFVCMRPFVANVSNQSAISSPSSWAVFARDTCPSCSVGPTAVPTPIGKSVAGSPTCVQGSPGGRGRAPVSPSAVDRNNAAISGLPSTSALFAKYRYRRFCFAILRRMRAGFHGSWFRRFHDSFLRELGCCNASDGTVPMKIVEA